MSLGDLFPDSLKNDFAKRNIDIGKAILIRIPDFNVNYEKYIVVISENEEDLQIAFVVINTEINEYRFPTPYLKTLHVSIDKLNHDFLDHDSFVNCSEIRIFDKVELIEFLTKKPENAVGNISEAILREIHVTITHARTITPAMKRKFGF